MHEITRQVERLQEKFQGFFFQVSKGLESNYEKRETPTLKGLLHSAQAFLNVDSDL